MTIGASFAADLPTPAPAPRAPANPNQTNIPPRAARTVQMVYDASESDVYYNEMIVEKSADNTFFCAASWYNGFLGLQQYNGENRRAVIFAIWDDAYNDDPKGPKSPARPVEVIYQDPRAQVNPYQREGQGKQALREFKWKIGEANKFAVQATLATNMTTYTAWVFDPAANKWEQLAVFRTRPRTPWLRGYQSFIEDFHRNGQSVEQTRLVRFRNVWNHEDQGEWTPLNEAMFTVGRKPGEARDRFNAGQQDGAFFLATGGETKKILKIGDKVRVQYLPPLRQEAAPDLPFLNLPPAKPRGAAAK